MKRELRKIGKNIWRVTTPLIYNISPIISSKLLYKLSTGKTLNLKEPSNFNEKLMWLKLYNENNGVVKCADKYEVRNYVEENGMSYILPKLFYVGNDCNNINWDNIPNKFALKCTHGCGFNIICTNKNKFNKEDSIKKINKWLKKRYVFEAIETQYDKMTPRVICEEYIETKDGVLPNDYKIYCFNGVPTLTLVCMDREKDMKMRFLDLNWDELPIGNEEYIGGTIPKKPECYEEMIKISKQLSKPFPFVRIDFYDKDGVPILGEMTFTPAGCAARYYNDFGLKWLGDNLNIEKLLK